MGIRICSQRCASLCGIGSGLDCRSRFPSDVMLVFAVCADELDLSGSANVQPWLWKRDIFVAMMSLRDVAGLFGLRYVLPGSPLHRVSTVPNSISHRVQSLRERVLFVVADWWSF